MNRFGDRTLLAAGVLSSTSISGQKWNDLNGDALHDANEPGLNGWVINVLDAAQNLIATTTTASVDLNGDGSINPVTEQGVYTVEVPPGDWVVQEEARAGWVETSPSSQAALTAAQLDAAVDLRTTQNDFLDWGHLSEKWLLGNDGWYFITPDGALSKWNLSPRTALSGTRVAQLSPWFYHQLSRLTNATDPADTLVSVTDEIHVTGLNVGNYRANGASGLRINGNPDPTLVPGNVRVWVSGGDVRIVGDQWDNQLGLFVDWQHNLMAVGLQGTTINGLAGPVVLLRNTSTVPGSVIADLGWGHDLIALQGFMTGKNVWINAGHGMDSVVALDLQVGGNFDVLSGWGAGNVAISNSYIANNLHIWGSEAQDDVILDKVIVSNFTNVHLGNGADRLFTRGSVFHDDTRVHLGLGNDVVVATGSNEFKRLLFVDGSPGSDAASANSVIAGRKVVRGIESNQVPNVEDLLDQVLSELATLGLDASLLR